MMNDLPIKLSKEGRKRMFFCPIAQHNVSYFSCFQCNKFDVKNLTCLYPKNADKTSRKITRAFAAKVAGRSLSDNVDKCTKVRVKGGMSDKVEFVRGLFLKGRPDKSLVFEKLKKQWPEISEGYSRTLYYRVLSEYNKKSGASR